MGLRRHFRPRRVRDTEFALFSSCSGMPMTDWAYETSEIPYHYVIDGEDRGDVENLLRELKYLFQKKFLNAISAAPRSTMLVASSPADASRMASVLFALACDGRADALAGAELRGEMGSDVPAGMRGAYRAAWRGSWRSVPGG